MGASALASDEADLTQSRKAAKEDKGTELDADCSEIGRSLRNRSRTSPLDFDIAPFVIFASLREILFFPPADTFVDLTGELSLWVRVSLAISIPGPKCNRSPMDTRQSPFVGEPPGILTQQPPGIDPITGECPAAEMMNEQIMRHSQFKPSPPRPLGKIVVIKEPQSKPVIKPADGVIDSPFHEQAKARQLGHGEPLPAMLIAPPASKRMHVLDITIRHALDQLRRRRIIGHGTNEADGAFSSRP
jgi:hypothetical protein